ncbi:MAG: phosphotransferase family protein [Pseudomonadales bacterium]|nr:phosphotransferase family protein [Pseudomonadales bacterium]
MQDSFNINLPALQQWFDGHLNDHQAIDIEPIKGGGSCELFSIRRGAERWAMRRAPLNAVSSSAHDVLREFAIIHAMQDAGLAVPKVLAAEKRGAITDADFYIMEYIDGTVIRHGLPEQFMASPETQPAIGEQLIDALVELHCFEWRGTGLEQLANLDAFLPRQIDRWLNQFSHYENGRDLPAVDSIAQWLRDHLPERGDLTVMHGDYKLDNAMFSHSVPPTLLRVVDFEMTTVGDPLVDLAWAMIFWPEEGNLIAIAAPDAKRGMAAEFCQSPAQLIARYAQATGRDMSQFQWYQVFAAWKLAIVLEASYTQFLAGKSKNPSHEFFGFVTDQLLIRAEKFAVDKS